MKKNIEVIKIEENLIYLQFSNNTIRKYLKENFLKEPYIGQKVEILNNGLIIEKHPPKKKIPNVKLQKITITIFILYIIFLLITIFKYPNILSQDNSIKIIIYIYILITLFFTTIYTYYINNKIIKIIFITLITLPIIIITLYVIIYILTIIWTFIACTACLFGG